MEGLHPNLYHGTPRPDLEAAIDAVRATLPAASDDELLVGLLKVVALVSANGRDGHTGAYVWGGGDYPLHSLPLRLWLFSDGVYVVDALPPYESLIGHRISTVAGRPIAAVQAALDPLIPRDNAETVTLLTPRFLLIPEVLHGLGLVAATDTVELGSVDGGGRETTTAVQSVPMAEYNAWAGAYGLDLPARPASGFLARMDEPLWWSDAGPSGVLSVQYNRVDGVSDPQPSTGSGRPWRDPTSAGWWWTSGTTTGARRVPSVLCLMPWRGRRRIRSCWSPAGTPSQRPCCSPPSLSGSWILRSSASR